MAAFLRDAQVAHAGQLGLAENDVLCRTSRGTLFRRDYYNREIWKPALAAVGLLADTTFHDYADVKRAGSPPTRDSPARVGITHTSA